MRGAYILADAPDAKPAMILIATGSEVPLALATREALAEHGVQARVVSMPSWELFDRQPESYRDEVLPPAVGKRLAIEAGIAQGWHAYVGAEGAVLGLNRFGASAPGQVVMEKLGFTVDYVVKEALTLLERP